MREKEECGDDEQQNEIMEPEDECEPAVYAAITQEGPSIFEAAAADNSSCLTVTTSFR